MPVSKADETLIRQACCARFAETTADAVLRTCTTLRETRDGANAAIPRIQTAEVNLAEAIRERDAAVSEGDRQRERAKAAELSCGALERDRYGLRTQVETQREMVEGAWQDRESMSRTARTLRVERDALWAAVNAQAESVEALREKLGCK